MNPGNYIALLDPALADDQGTVSSNLGDLIISKNVNAILQQLFPTKEILRFATHSYLNKEQLNLINKADLSFIGGTNLLHSDMLHYRKLMLRDGKLLWLFPGIKNLILMGCGWGPQPDMKMKTKTRFLFKKILHPGFVHSCRDQFSANKLGNEANIKSVNTACPTMWALDGFNTNLDKKNDMCLLTLTDYATDCVRDSLLIAKLLDHFKQIVFFPQGLGDIDYLFSLSIYAQNKGRFNLLPHSIDEFYNFAKEERFIYIGTRLHCGIYCMTENKPAMIISVDNRSLEIAKDTFLPVCHRNDLQLLSDWLSLLKVFKNPITLPIGSIDNWKSQF